MSHRNIRNRQSFPLFPAFVIDTISCHGSDLVTNNLEPVEGLYTSEHPGNLGSLPLLGWQQIVKLVARKCLALDPLTLGEDSNPPADGLGGVLVFLW